MHEGRRRADHLLLLALGEDDPPRLPAQPFIDALQHAGDRIEPAAQLLPIAAATLDVGRHTTAGAGVGQTP